MYASVFVCVDVCVRADDVLAVSVSPWLFVAIAAHPIGSLSSHHRQHSQQHLSSLLVGRILMLNTLSHLSNKSRDNANAC
jgi:hypothetical protein